MALSSIEWTRYTFNPWRGCVHDHTGCINCYAEVQFSVKMHGIKWGTESEGGTRKRASKNYLNQPFKWDRESSKRDRVFCGSLCDVFEPWEGAITSVAGVKLFSPRRMKIALEREPLTMQECREDLFDVIRQTKNLDWLLVSKHGFFSVPYNVQSANDGILKMWPKLAAGSLEHFKNVWLLTSVSDQQTHDLWCSELYKCRPLARVCGLSVEPLVGPIDLTLSLPWIDWIIVGGESGPRARPCHEEWIASIVAQCRGYGVPVFVKQMGSRPIFEDGERRLNHKKGGDPLEWTSRIRFREYPKPLSV